jgi:hypothetical protein
MILKNALDEFAQAFPDRLNLLVLDKRGGPTAKQLVIPENVRLVWLPPYAPELNPIERVWRDLQDPCAWQQFSDIEARLCGRRAVRLRCANAAILNRVRVFHRGSQCTGSLANSYYTNQVH